MNLAIDPWIPIVWKDGRSGLVSLNDAFARGEDIADLAVRPHERIALMRLLICIAQAALDGPADEEDWKTCRPHMAPLALAYLDKWKAAFEMLGDKKRFLQLPGLRPKDSGRKKDEEDDGNSVSKLDLALATGNNATLFDNAGGSDRAFSPDRLALSLLTFQCFSPGGRIGIASWRGAPTPGKGSSLHAPCAAGNMLHAFIRGENVLKSVHLNMLTKKQVQRFAGDNRWGAPIWERFPQSFKDSESIENATATYLGRLVPISRAIHLGDDGRTAILANGWTYPPFPAWREPAATVVVRKKGGNEERALLRASIEKAAWRELHALAVKSADARSNGGPLPLANQNDEAVDLWTGGFVANKAKPLDVVESVFHLPAAMFNKTAQDTYEAGVECAQKHAGALQRAIASFHREIGDSLDRKETRDRSMAIKGKALSHFWTSAEEGLPRLLAVAAECLAPASWEQTEWGMLLRHAASDAFAHACPHETPRQMRAYVFGLKALTEWRESAPSETEKEDET